jgi:hypothetical protein
MTYFPNICIGPPCVATSKLELIAASKLVSPYESYQKPSRSFSIVLSLFPERADTATLAITLFYIYERIESMDLGTRNLFSRVGGRWCAWYRMKRLSRLTDLSVGPGHRALTAPFDNDLAIKAPFVIAPSDANPA